MPEAYSWDRRRATPEYLDKKAHPGACGPRTSECIHRYLEVRENRSVKQQKPPRGDRRKNLIPIPIDTSKVKTSETSDFPGGGGVGGAGTKKTVPHSTKII